MTKMLIYNIYIIYNHLYIALALFDSEQSAKSWL